MRDARASIVTLGKEGGGGEGLQPEDRWRNVILIIEIQTRGQRGERLGGPSSGNRSPWKWELRGSFGGDRRNEPRKNGETWTGRGKRCNGKIPVETREKEKWREGKIERTWKLKKNSGREEPGICGGHCLLSPCFECWTWERVECLKLKLGCIGVKIEKTILVGNKWNRWEFRVTVYCVLEVLHRKSNILKLEK